jgi:formylglycine-generating enzyme required for sulfatase activity
MSISTDGFRQDEEPDVSIRRALLLSLGQFDDKDWAAAARRTLVEKLRHLYRTAEDPGIHAAAEWLLRQWKEEAWLRETNQAWAIDKERRSKNLEAIKHVLRASRPSPGAARWYVNGQGQTLVVIPGPVEFWMGCPAAEEGREGGPEGKLELRHWRRIGRSFAIAAKEVTVEQFRSFRDHHDYNKFYAPSSDCPVNVVTWYQAVQYCNWLSKKEGIPPEEWCYLENARGEFAEGMKPAPGYLKRAGYRLPTEAEWEYACRAGATTSRYFGESEDLLGKYAWYSKNSLDRWMLPCASLKPNDLGLFDMLGNALEWCHDPITFYQPGKDGLNDDGEFQGTVTDNERRLLRGGSFSSHPQDLRSASRSREHPPSPDLNNGFRVARTFR